jgi:DUF1680 family protein
MKRLHTISFSMLFVVSLHAQTKPASGYPITPVAFTAVKVLENTFWGQRLKASREVTIPLAFNKCEETGRYVNFEQAAHPSDKNVIGGRPFDDTDVYKTIEGASYELQTYPNKRLEQYLDSIIDIVAKAQEPDGYLYTARTANPEHPHSWSGSSRWEKEEVLSHELYNLGHLVEGAVAHYQATGKRNLLNIAIKFADCVCREVGDKPGQSCVVPGHQIAEMALCRLYLATGDKKYLDEAKFFLDKRGYTKIHEWYNQSEKPILQQDEAVGHAVRAGYMYSGIADVAALTGDKDYIVTIDRIWENIVSKKYYLTGGVGATSNGEAFGANYELPNYTAYNETCAAIAQVYLNYRLFLLHGESKYYDALERTLYNGVLSGLSLDGGAFFYPNPLACKGNYQRQPWFGCSCCPSNLARFIPSVPGYVYAVKDNAVFVNLFMSNTATLTMGKKKVVLTQTTNYPWDGDVQVKVGTKADFAMKVRIPGWVRNEVVPSNLYSYSDGQQPHFTVSVNGKAMTGSLQDGYFVIERSWKKGDVVSVHFDMIPRTVVANTNVTADKGCMAFERGPLVYCAEWPDNNFDILQTIVYNHPSFETAHDMLNVAPTTTSYATMKLGNPAYKPTTSYPIVTLSTTAQIIGSDGNGKLVPQDVHLKLIPYYAWAHRGDGKMTVWFVHNIGEALER